MPTSRDTILNKLRQAKRPFPDAPPRPADYMPVTSIDDVSPEGLLARFTVEIERLNGRVLPVDGDDAARDTVVELLQQRHAEEILAWHFNRIPIRKLRGAIEEAGIHVLQPDLRDEFRAEVLEACREVPVGLTGAAAAVATTGTLIVRTEPGMGRLPTILPPVHIAVITLDQLLPRLEDWVASERADGLPNARSGGNICFISGTSRTGDIEQKLVLGVHGPGELDIVVKR